MPQPPAPQPTGIICATMVMPKLQMSDFTLYPFWLSSGFILSGCNRKLLEKADSFQVGSPEAGCGSNSVVAVEHHTASQESHSRPVKTDISTELTDIFSWRQRCIKSPRSKAASVWPYKEHDIQYTITLPISKFPRLKTNSPGTSWRSSG